MQTPGLAGRGLDAGSAVATAAVVGAIAAAAVLGVVSVVVPAAAVAAPLGIIFVAAAFRALAAGVALFTVVIFFQNIPGVAAPGLGFIKVFGAVLLLAALSKRGRPVLFRDRPALAYGIAFFVSWALASTLWAVDSSAAQTSIVRLVLSVTLVYVMFAAVEEPRHVKWVVTGYITGALLTAFFGLAKTSPESANESVNRLAGGIGDPNFLGAMLVPAVALSCFALAAFSRSLIRWLLVACVVVFSLSLFLTQSRGGLVALGVTFVAAIALAGPVRRQAVAMVLTILAIGLVYFTLVAPPQALHRITHFAAGGGAGRTDLWSIATRVIHDHPLLGVGANNFRVVEPTYASGTVNLPHVNVIVDSPHAVHNTYLEVLAELGSVGLVAFAAVVVASLGIAFRSLRAFARDGEWELEMLTRGLIVGIFGILGGITFVSAEFEKQLWLLLGLAAALSSLAGSQRMPAEEAERVTASGGFVARSEIREW